MESLYLLIPVSIFVVFVIVIFLFWSIRNGQFDDLQGPGYKVIMDDDTNHLIDKKNESKNDTTDRSIKKIK